ncbi:MAG: PD40 domain-containing protein [Ignavibacteriales bacterium]|nr:PD40 domain-containing protein [Ignavibacteriales bacterium]MCB9209816.1 PD40 domain-containing protein [Ignavibacteriales bacterium]
MRIHYKYIFLILVILTSNIYSQLYFFGRNKVHYEDFEWKVIKTEHFDIYYYDDFEEMAEIGANYAEEAFDELKVKFNHIILQKIPLIFYNTHTHFQQTNTLPGFIPEGVGGFFEFLKGRVVIPYLSSLDQFRHVIRHELVHVFMTSKVINLIKDHRLISESYPPLWFVEGIAEFWSYHWDSQAEMVMRDAVLNGIFVPLKDMYRIYGTFLMYKEGQNFLYFVAEKYGEDKILSLLENIWRFKNFEDVIEFTLNERFEKIDEDWLYYLKQKYYPLYKDKTPHFIDSKKLTNEGYNFSPNYYKNGEKDEIYFIANRSGYSSVYKMNYNPDSSDYLQPEIIIEGEKEAIFETFHLSKPSMAVSKNGIMAFVTKSGATDALHIYDINKEELTNNFKFSEILTIESPSFSKDGNKIVFHGTDRKGYIDIYILDIFTGTLQRITNDYYSDNDPVLNEDNSKVIFSSDRTSGNFQQSSNLFEIEIKTGEIKYISYSDANLTAPKFSPDYKSLYCLSDADGNNNIWQIEFENDQPIGMEQKTRFLTSVFEYTFVNNSELITSSFEKFSFQFYSLDLESIPDSIDSRIDFDFTQIDEAWIADKIVVNPETDKLKYENDYTLDYAVSQVSTDPIYGTRGGAVFALSDLLGDDKYYFILFNSAEIQSDFFKNLNVAISKVSSGGRTNYGYGIFHFIGRRYDLRQSDDFFYERNFGGYFSLLYPLSSFQRFEASVTVSNSDRELNIDLLPRKALLLSNTISFVHDNTIWSQTGPMDGSRFRLLLGYTSDIQYSNTNFYSLIADYRYYYRLHNRVTLASRASIYYNHGKDARRYIAGGSWDLRGWPRFKIRGEKLWISSVELRYPLLDQFYLKFPFMGLGFSGIKGAMFLDAGSAWDNKYDQTIGSVGVGLRFNFLGAITFRYDVGKRIIDNFSSLSGHMFYHFFFGWDF